MSNALLKAIIILIALVSLQCNTLQINENNSITAVFISPGKIKFTFNFKNFGYVGIGFAETMHEADMIIVEFLESGFSVKDTYSFGEGRPKEDTEVEGTDDIINKSLITYNDGSADVIFERKLATGDKRDFDIKIGESQVITFGWKFNSKLSYHGSKNKLKSTLFIDEFSKKINFGEAVSSAWLYEIHGISMLVLWTVFNLFGFIFIRHFRFLSLTRVIHGVGSGLTSLATILAASVALNESQGRISIDNLHGFIGIIIFSLSSLQVLLGAINLALVYYKQMNNDFIHKFKIIHRLNGILLTVTCYGSLITGFGRLYGGIPLPIILCAVMLSIILAFELYYNLYLHGKRGNIVSKLYNLKTSKLPKISTRQLEQDKETKSWVLIDNIVCDITDFLPNHPGGVKILQDNLFSDVSRFLTGTSGANKGFSQYQHKVQTIQHALDKYAYAVLDDDHQIAVDMSPQMNCSSVYINEDCYKVDQIEVAKNTFCYKFFTYNKEIKYSQALPGYDFIGRHFSLYSRKLNKTRLYSTCLILNQENRDQHERLLNKIHSNEEIEESDFVELPPLDSINLHVKRYNKSGAMSNYLSGLVQNDDLIIRGPIGLGLNLPRKLKGTYLAVAGGTGVFCFLDFVAYVLRLMVRRIADAKKIKLPGKFNEESFENVDDSFKLVYFSSFSDGESSVFHDICLKMHELSVRHSLELFEFYPRISSTQHERWTSKYFEKALEGSKTIERVFLCGPTAFLDDIKEELLLSKKVCNDEIFMV